MEEQVQKALDSIRPVLQADGGDVELVGVVGTVVKVRLRGACGCCPMSTYTLKLGIEKRIKEQVPGITAVEQVQ